jgi:hypothetical protein
LHFPSEQIGSTPTAISPIRQAPLSAVKVLALSRNSGGTAGSFAPRPDEMDGRFLFAPDRTKARKGF